MAYTPFDLCQRIFAVAYRPQPNHRAFLDRAQTQDAPEAEVTVAVLDAAESARLFGVPLARRGIQPVFLRITNRGTAPLRLYLLGIDPNYFTPLEAAASSHFSFLRRFAAFGALGLLFLPLLMLLIPGKLLAIYFANRRMDLLFQSAAYHLRPVPPGKMAEGFVFTRVDVGLKTVHVCLHAASESLSEAIAAARDGVASLPPVRPTLDFTFTIAVPGIRVDHLGRDFAAICPPEAVEECDVPTLVERLQAMPATTRNQHDSRSGDPLNLIVVGEFETLLTVFSARWDESETITLRTCWKTARSFLLGSQYRYSPVSPLYLFGRSQDVALQRIRHSINERLHLRLWLSPLRMRGLPVWVGQISRDIGVRFTPKTWNLTTHRIDPDIDESRDYVVEDLLAAERAQAVAYVSGVGACVPAQPRHNLTGDPYFTDGKRAAIVLSAHKTAPRFVAWS
ncbi:MAG TPA: LssY C-terminal domain-containing protein [Pirellulales bacterium]|jgi:hypothetical protein|nr:LssY C-terminal domain-containing protein [Pirellulales bacterium]